MSDFAQPRLTLGRLTIHATLLLACAVYGAADRDVADQLQDPGRHPYRQPAELAGGVHGHGLADSLGCRRWLLLELGEDRHPGGADLHRAGRHQWLRAVDVALPRLAAVLRSVVVRLLPAVPGDPAAGVLHPRQAGPANTTTGLVLVHVVYGLAFTTVLPQLLSACRKRWCGRRGWMAPVSSPSSGASCCRCRYRSSWSA